jgi:GH15 family glucan-1,4-alpha-glucosidase
VKRDDAGYLDLRGYAAVGDGRTVALIGVDGRIDWLPLPDLDSVPVFGALLDAENGGFIELVPIAPYSSARQYINGTNVLATIFTTDSGTARVTDSMNTGLAGRLPWAELARRIEGIDGSVDFTARVVPGTCLNTASPWTRRTRSGETVLRADGLIMSVRTLNASSVVTRERDVTATYRTAPGSRHLLALVAADREPLFLPKADDIDAGIDRTVDNWVGWTNNFSCDGPWAKAVERSALALKLLIFAPTGAIVAAPTTSLPESATGEKNWDYRYAWVRDMAYSLTALFRFGLREEIHAAMSWLLATIHEQGPRPRTFYTLNGKVVDGEISEYDVPGWRSHHPVRSGNQAINQLQLGVFGDIFSIVRLWVDHGNVLDEGTSRTLALVADTACDTWRSKDSGMWELETERHYTTSKMGCWKALTDAVHLVESGEMSGDVERWSSEAELIRDWVETNCWSEKLGSYIWYPGSDALDTSVVLHAISGYDRGARMSSTLDALRKELGDGPHLYRYSGAQAEEHCFIACSYWMASALHLVGRADEARQLMDELISAPNDVGLLSEMIDAKTGEFWGNLPQALSHLALLHAAITLSPDEPGPDVSPRA